MKKIITLVLLIGVLFLTYWYREDIMIFLVDRVLTKEEVNFQSKNAYYLSYKFDYVQNVDKFSLQNREDLMNLYFTVINSGVDEFSFYCPNKYEHCIDDVIDLANNPDYLSNINGFVHPFNSFDTIETTYDSLGRVKLKVVKTYTNLEIEKINQKVKEIIESEVKDEKDTRTIIRLLHDYIINHTKYDKARTDYNVIKYASNTAYGVLFEGYGICSGYADAMALFLNYYQIPNYKIVSENHVWNAVYLDGNWYHLDLTWDDPMLDSGEDVLDDTYFLVTTERLKELDDNQHIFDEEIFQEMASS